jgi:hypothetical protein
VRSGGEGRRRACIDIGSIARELIEREVSGRSGSQ